MKAVYLVVAGRIRRELRELEQVVERIERIWQRRTATVELESDDDYYIDAIALNLHGFYAGIERLLEVIAEGVDQTKPAGASWHRELLQQLTTDIPSVRPAVLSFETRDRLDRYRGFRHVVRNVYTFNLDSADWVIDPTIAANASSGISGDVGFCRLVRTGCECQGLGEG